MSVDVATLVFEFKSDSAAHAEKAMDRLIAKGAQLEGVAKKTHKATDFANESHKGAAQSADRMAQSATALAAAEGAVERATRSAGRASAEVRAQRQLEAAAMRELVQATRSYERDQARASAAAVRATREQAAAVSSLEARIFALKSSIDPAFAAQSRLDAEMREATALYKMGAISSSDYAKAVGQLDQRMAELTRQHSTLTTAQGRTAASSGAVARAGLNMSRQFTDIGVQLAGQTPLYLVLIQQLPQIADGFAQAKLEGASFGMVMKGLLAPLLGIGAAIAAVVGVVGSAAIGFGLLNRELQKGFPKDVTDGLRLTEEQLGRVKHKTVTTGDVFMATISTIGKYMRSGPLGDAIGWLGKQWNDFLDDAASFAFEAAATITGVFVGSYRTIVNNWRSFPAVLRDLFVMAMNAAIDQAQKLLNATIQAINTLKQAAAVFNPALGLIPNIPEADLSRFKGQVSSAAEFAGKALRSNVVGAIDDARDGLRKLGSEIGAGALKRATDRALKEAKDPNKTPKGAADPRDRSAEFSAEVEAMIASAMGDELQARLALAKEASARATIERQLVQEQLRVQQAQVDKKIADIEDAKGLSASEKALLTFQLQAVQAMNERTAALQSAAISETEQAALAVEALESQQAGRRNQIDLLSAQADLTKSAYARAAIEVDILKAQQAMEKASLRAVTVQNGATAAAEADAQRRLAALDQIHELELAQAQQQTRLVDAISEAADAVDGFRSAFKRHDFGGVLDNLQRVIETIQASFARNGLSGGLMTAGSAAASLIGGKTGRAIGGGLGIAGLGMSAGPVLGAVMTAFPSLMAGAAGTAALAVAPLLGPIGMAAGALYAAAKLLNVGGKPTNAGAGVDLVTGAISGNKRTSETEQAALGAANTIKAAQDALKAAGITLGATVDGLVIGTRDLSQIYLSNGKTLTSAVGDSAAAVDAAMKGILEGATYQSDAQKKLVESAMAAGKSFDELATILDTYAQAQKLAASIDDQILQLTDPKAFDLQAVTRDIQAQRDAAKELEKQGYLTADQLADLTAKLGTLEGLQTKSVLDRYGAANDNANALATAEEAAKDALMNAYNAFSQAKQAEIAAARQAADALKSFRQELTLGDLAGRDPTSQYLATKREFDRLNALAANDPERMANLASVGRAFAEASRAASPTQLAFERDIAAVRRATELSERSAYDQANIAQAQLDAATAQLEQLGLLNKNTVDFQTALKAYLAARDAAASSGGANDNAFDVARYLRNNPDLAANWAEGGILRHLGPTLETAAQAHYDRTGKMEIAQGLRGYAAGGFHPGGVRLVGEEGPEIEATGPARYYSANQTARMLGGDTARLEALVEELTRKVDDLTREVTRGADAVENSDARGKRQEFSGVFVRGEAPDEPIKTVAA